MTTPASSDPRYEALAAYALGTLPAEERDAVRAWIAESADARQEFEALQEAVGALALAAPQIEPPPALRARVLAIADAGSRPGARPAPAVSTRWTVWPALAAAAIVAALGLGAYATHLRTRVAALEARLGDAQARLVRAEAEARRTQALLARAEVGRSVLGAPDLRRVDLAGQAPAPAARARAFWSRARGLVLNATGLPGLPRGRTYQLWLLAEGAPVSAGVFTVDASGGATVVIDSPPGVPSPKGMAVSVEPDGGSPAPTGAIVLAGTSLGE
ncbi:hypothetical protein TBR22_A41670 [Luteitalea sp. TBR-22]|uniref:anti-sigma factor n=1 Tax=Luteitalea sp. TBR-22 TaxID=2802971 RepID=UPI001AF3225A|nr:anti-sigma factor [Luteitalea sp. TBR-22]BCS34941.1 hypothetical protein TBR22_A41670 [Luteitalea sp. TBR-22]